MGSNLLRVLITWIKGVVPWGLWIYFSSVRVIVLLGFFILPHGQYIVKKVTLSCAQFYIYNLSLQVENFTPKNLTVEKIKTMEKLKQKDLVCQIVHAYFIIHHQHHSHHWFALPALFVSFFFFMYFIIYSQTESTVRFFGSENFVWFQVVYVRSNSASRVGSSTKRLTEHNCDWACANKFGISF